MPTSQAKVPTDAAPRYAKQLLSHLGRKRQVEALEGEPDGGRAMKPPSPGAWSPSSFRAGVSPSRLSCRVEWPAKGEPG